MSKKFLTPIKLAQGASNPAVGSAGELFFNTTDVKVYAHNGTSWVPSGGGVTVSATAPATPIAGDAWYDTVDGTLYVYYNDGDSSQWVEVAANSGISVALEGRVGVVETYVTTLQTETRSVPLGGTGATSFTSGSYLKGAGTSAITAQAGIPAADITSGNLAVAQGGTGVLTGTGLVPVIPSSVSVGSGSASVSDSGIISFSGSTSVSINNIFSTSYKSYRLIVTIDSASSATELLGRVRTTSDNTANYFQGGTRTLFVGTTSSYSLSNGSAIYFNHVATDASRTTTYALDISYPNTTLCTSWTGSGYGNISGSGPSSYHTSGIILDVIQYTGFTIITATGTSNLTGTVQVYGYR
jgi:hypothetical protein